MGCIIVIKASVSIAFFFFFYASCIMFIRASSRGGTDSFWQLAGIHHVVVPVLSFASIVLYLQRAQCMSHLSSWNVAASWRPLVVKALHRKNTKSSKCLVHTSWLATLALCKVFISIWLYGHLLSFQLGIVIFELVWLMILCTVSNHGHFNSSNFSKWNGNCLSSLNSTKFSSSEL